MTSPSVSRGTRRSQDKPKRLPTYVSNILIFGLFMRIIFLMSQRIELFDVDVPKKNEQPCAYAINEYIISNPLYTVQFGGKSISIIVIFLFSALIYLLFNLFFKISGDFIIPFVFSLYFVFDKVSYSIFLMNPSILVVSMFIVFGFNLQRDYLSCMNSILSAVLIILMFVSCVIVAIIRIDYLVPLLFSFVLTVSTSSKKSGSPFSFNVLLKTIQVLVFSAILLFLSSLVVVLTIQYMQLPKFSINFQKSYLAHEFLSHNHNFLIILYLLFAIVFRRSSVDYEYSEILFISSILAIINPINCYISGPGSDILIIKIFILSFCGSIASGTRSLILPILIIASIPLIEFSFCFQ